MPLLPTALTLEAYGQQFRDPKIWAPAFTALAQQYAPGQAPETIQAGSALVCQLGPDQVLKLLPPFWQHEAATEIAALQVAQDRLSVATPTLIAQGELEGWPYLILEALPGTPLALVWRHLDHANRLFLLQQLGELIQELRALPIPAALSTLSWSERLRQHQANLDKRLAQAPIPTDLCTALQQLATPLALTASQPLFLHGDLNSEHLLVYQQNGRWELCGLLDFGDALVGPAAYELIAPVSDLGLTQDARMRLWEAAGLDPPSPFLPWVLSHAYGPEIIQESLLPQAQAATVTALELLLSQE